MIYCFDLNILTNIRRHPIVRQITGAALGTVIALGAYAVFTIVSPYAKSVFPASLTMDSVPLYSEEERAENINRVAQLAQHILMEDKKD